MQNKILKIFLIIFFFKKKINEKIGLEPNLYLVVLETSALPLNYFF